MKNVLHNKRVKKLIASMLALVMVVNMIQSTTFSVHASDTQSKMIDNGGDLLEFDDDQFQVKTLCGKYDGTEQSLITDIVGLEPGIICSYNWDINDEEGWEFDHYSNLKAKEVKSDYNFYVRFQKEGYSELIVPCTASIENGEFELSVNVYNGVYDGNEHAVITSIDGLPEEAKVEYSETAEEDSWTEECPTVTNVKDAAITPVYVRVTKEFYNTFDNNGKAYSATITPATFSVEVKTIDIDYDRNEHDIFTLVGAEDEDVVSFVYSENGDLVKGDKDLKVAKTEVGTYKFDIIVERNDNYYPFEKKDCVSKINPIEIQGYTAKLATGLVYDSEKHELVTLNYEDKFNLGLNEDDVITYTVEYTDNCGEKETYTTNDTPEGSEAGTYIINIDISRNANYFSKHFDFDSCVQIAKKNQVINFTGTDIENLNPAFEGTKIVLDLSATCDTASTERKVTYEYEIALDNSGVDKTTVAKMSEDGKLTILKAGYPIAVMAKVAGDNNYNEAETAEPLIIVPICKESGLVKFAKSTVEFKIGNSDTVSDQAAIKKYNDDYGSIAYSAVIGEKDSLSDYGLAINESTGKVTVNNIAKLSSKLEEKDSITVTVTVNKGIGYKYVWHGWFIFGYFSWDPVYAAAEATYSINITAEAVPEVAYTVFDDKGNKLSGPNGTNDWYNTAVIIKPADGYSISKTVCGEFSESVEFNDQGINDSRIVYLKNITTGAITRIIKLTDVIKLDSVAPDANDITITYSEPKNIIDKIRYYNTGVEVTFTAIDVTSGVDHFDWVYTRTDNASNSNLGTDCGTLEAKQDEKDSTKFYASVILPKDVAEQINGSICVTATDKADNTSFEKNDIGNIFVVDTIDPTKTVTHTPASNEVNQNIVVENEEEVFYYSGDVIFTFDITEINFFSEDVEILVAKNNEAPVRQCLTWQPTKEADQYEASLTLSEDGDYVVTVNYADRSTNEMVSYTSNKIVVDTIDPEIYFTYKDYKDTVEPQSIELVIVEHNFNAKDIKVKQKATDINLNDVYTVALQEYFRTYNWVSEGDVHTAKVSSDLADAIYNLSIDYSDLALNAAKTNKPDEFIVDRTAPSAEKITVEYSTPVYEKVLNTVTFGYYKENVELTFTAYDVTSGVDYFTYAYTKEKNASSVNVAKYEDEKVTAVQDDTDKSKFTAVITLPKEEAEQLRGSVNLTATDKCANESDKVDESNHVFVRDTIAPKISVEYSPATNKVEKRNYYNTNITATFTITEANFYEEDVIVKVEKNKGTPSKVDLKWEAAGNDVYKASYTINANASNDGDYVFYVDYTDRSGNKMVSYVSDVYIMDVTIPEIKVTYSDTNPNTELTDVNGKTRKYFNGTQTATITIVEHNFNQEAVGFSILSSDVNGSNSTADSLVEKSGWTSNGDTRTMSITFKNDGNYTFDVDCTDYANNKAKDYSEDYFTVDKSAPSDLKVDYSRSVLDVVLSAVSFGFYNSKATVTITATDITSGVHGFEYDYVVAPGVSSVNKGMIDQAIEEASISFSDGRKVATATFEIPRNLLSNTEQFNGTISFTAKDRAGNESDELADGKRIVIDNINPTSSIDYNAPVQSVNGVSYYAGNINATITMTEANFYAEDVVVTVTRNGAAYQTSINWTDVNTDTHSGTFTLTEEGDYFVSVSYQDKSSNAMATYQSQQMTIDTTIEEASININGADPDGRAFKDDIDLDISFSDINFDNFDLTITRTSLANKNQDVTSAFIGNGMTRNANGASGSFSNFEKIKENDGIYTLRLNFRDYAGHTVSQEKTFTVNRFGSVYEYNDYLVSLIENGGAFIQNVDSDLVITEYNADKLVKESLEIEITKDGRPIDEVKYSVSPEISEATQLGESGWYQYQYTISKDNFGTDGVYKVAVSSKDATGNTPENTPDNTNYEANAIIFRVDATAPEINSITGLETKIINATQVDVNYTVYDTIGLANVGIYVDDEQVVNIEDFTSDESNFTGSFTLEQKSSAQSIRLVVMDLAGNVTDTAKEDYVSAFVFNDTVTISTNAFVRLYANQVLFWATTIAVIIAVPGVSGGIVAVRRKKNLAKVKADK